MGSIAKKEEILEMLSCVMRGEECGAKPVTAGERLKAAELLGKRYGIFERDYSGENADIALKLIAAIRASMQPEKASAHEKGEEHDG